MSKMQNSLIVCLVVLFVTSLVLGAGKITVKSKMSTKSEADVIYGVVNESSDFSRVKFIDMIDKADEYVLCGIINNQTVITDENRNLLSPYKLFIAGIDRQPMVPGLGTIDQDIPLAVFEKKDIMNLINSSSSLTITVEKRGEKITISNGDYTICNQTVCPPICLRFNW